MGERSASPAPEAKAAADSEVADAASAAAKEESLAESIASIFSLLDENKDGVIAKTEFMSALQKVCPDVPERDLLDLFEAADADGDSEIHYCEFAAWICSEDASAVSQVLRRT